MALTAVAAVFVGFALRPLALFALRTEGPAEIGPLTDVQLDGSAENSWVHATGELAESGIEYQRPLDSDTYRLVSVKGTPRLWVELRVPPDIESEHYVAPNSFVGRLVPVRKAGLRHAALGDAVEAATARALPGDAWVLIDGEAPANLRWAIGLELLFAGFAAFNVWGIARLLRPVHDA
jgi:hypothetical protein